VDYILSEDDEGVGLFLFFYSVFSLSINESLGVIAILVKLENGHGDTQQAY